ncbi:Fur family transcriptional regulator, ferric uptake regulator [Parafrankia irregularis]|uniref:Fur family transcriptional regulator, ferric uptake regulator n=1 Tax=Parafrankia irregularis TaxID=795642 RepID=A0A0S4QP55_9ACTN|nr:MULTISPECIES: Fur family transcriptional regulator [Parafrankia]MBE3200499.1 transcriptional repressor [Parafrankia sp. CH37]CUU56830.1 Fur family transcriptional regulator, ferric uptake regulator [Parafrankia irregularis]
MSPVTGVSVWPSAARLRAGRFPVTGGGVVPGGGVRGAGVPGSAAVDADGGPIDAGIAVLRRRGERVTSARRAVLEILSAASEHLSAEEVFGRALAVSPGLHRTTVYRALERLGELGLVTHVHTDHGPAFYHLSAPLTGAPHLHVRCRACERIVDVPADVLDDAARRLRDGAGFLLLADHTALAGLCSDCLDRNADADVDRDVDAGSPAG